MDRQIITFEANEQTLIKTGGLDNYSSNKVSYIEAHFALRQNWAGYDSVRAVWSTRYECISTVLDTEGICVVPYEVLKWKDKVIVNLVGSISEDDVLTDRITTYPIKALEVDADAKVCGSNTQPITPSEYEQFVEAVKADADRAEDAKDEARGFASSAEISAQNASISETNASTSEDNAKASELNAEAYKNQAQTYAQNANNSAISAENAKDEAEDARDTILGMRAEATTLPEGSSATASYNDGVMSFGIPKGDTGARGATGETGATPQLSIGTVETTTEPSVTITGTAENPVLNFGLVKGDKGDTGEVSLADLSTLLPTDTASGAIASFPDGQSVIPALSVVADIEPIQSGSGTPSPDNIRPISGHDEVNVSVCGVNLLDPQTITVGKFYNNTLTEVSNASKAHSEFIKIKPSTSYCLNGYAGQGFYAMLALDANKQPLASWYGGASKSAPFVATTPSNACYVVLNFNADQVSTIAFYESATVDGYIAYNGTTYEVSFGTAGTVYGGTVDVVSGVLTVDRAIVTLGGTTLWSMGTTSTVRYFNASMTPLDTNAWETNIVSNLFGKQSDGTPYCQINGAKEVRIVVALDDTNYDTVAKVQALLTQTPLTVMYPLATPTTYQLTPTEVQTLLGQNNIWNDCGDTEVTYKADVTKWVEKQLS